MEYNNGFVRGLMGRIAKNTVGQGIRFQARVRADERRLEIPKINQAMAEVMQHDRTDLHRTSERGWNPPPKGYNEELG